MTSGPIGSEANSYVAVCNLSDLPLGSAKACQVDGRAIALFHSELGIFATDEFCTHGQASLVEGFIEGDEIECPLHAGRFCLRTGSAVLAPAVVGLQTHEVSVVEGVIKVAVVSA